MSFKKTLLATSTMLFVGAALAASPNPATATFQVLFKVNKACTVAATNLDLGVQEVNGTVITAAGNGTVTVTCSKTTPYTVGLVPGNGNALGAGVLAGLTGGNLDTLTYTLYQNAGLTTVWGNTVGTNTLAGVGTGSAAAAVNVYGKITTSAAALLTTTPDNYKDTVTVNVAY